MRGAAIAKIFMTRVWDEDHLSEGLPTPLIMIDLVAQNAGLTLQTYATRTP